MAPPSSSRPSPVPGPPLEERSQSGWPEPTPDSFTDFDEELSDARLIAPADLYDRMIAARTDDGAL